MIEAKKIEMLKRVDCFRDISSEHLEELGEICQEVDFRGQTTIFEQYQLAKDVYVIVSGKVSLAICDQKNACRQISVVGAGELLGWSPLMGRPRLFDTARTQTPVKAFVFDGSELLEYCKSHSEFGFEFMHRAAQALAQRLSDTTLRLLELKGSHLPEFAIESD